MTSCVWKIGTKRAMVYVEGKETAQRVLEAAGTAPPESASPTTRRPRLVGVEAYLQGAMAVYLDRKGKPFAWQILFDASRLPAVEAALQ
ncbi:MAG: hypothetical protein QM758_15850 [Armatimonas sp.]